MIFVSHSENDEAIYSALRIALDAASIPRWDVKNMLEGKPLGTQLRDAVDKCSVCIFVATRASVGSQWCSAELGAFWGANKPVIIYLADSTLNQEELPPQFQGSLNSNSADRLIESIRKYLDKADAKLDSNEETDNVRQVPINSNVVDEPIEPIWGDKVADLLKSARDAALNKQFESALLFSTNAVELAPNCPRAHGNRATALVHLRRYAEAEEIYNYICTNFSEHTVLVARTLHNKAWLLINVHGLSDPEVLKKCKELYLSALSLDNHRLPSRAMALLCFALLGEYEEASLFLKTAIQWEGFLDALKKQVDLLGRQGFQALESLPEWLQDIMYPMKKNVFPPED